MYRFTDHFLVPVGVSMYADSAVFCPIDTHPPIYPNPARPTTDLSVIFWPRNPTKSVLFFEVRARVITIAFLVALGVLVRVPLGLRSYELVV